MRGMRSRRRSVILFGFLLSACAGGDGRGQQECSNGSFAAVNLGEAVARVRGARLLAEQEDRRLALARLESMLVSQIQSEPDTIARQAAWYFADLEVWIESAEADREQIEKIGSLAPDDKTRDEYLREETTERYREHMSRVVQLLDPRTPRECAQLTWQAFYSVALDAQAR